jgi:hypothetical protein
MTGHALGNLQELLGSAVIAESSAIIWPLLAAVPNIRESNGMVAIGWLSMVLAKARTSISGRFVMPT